MIPPMSTSPPDRAAWDALDDPHAIALDPRNVLPRQLATRADEDPAAPFLVEADHGRTATYGAFWDQVRRWVDVLAGLGARPGDNIATMLPSSIDAHAVWIATSLMGAHEVPVNPELRGEFLDHVLTDAAVRTCLARPEHVAVVTSTRAGAEIDVHAVPADTPPTTDATAVDVTDLPGPADTSCIIYTSGTTGPAKGVVISWAQMSSIIGRIPREVLSSSDAVYSPWPMFHVTGRSPLISMADIGGRVVLRERFRADEFWDDVRTYACTSTTVGAGLSLLLARPERDDDADNPLRITLLGRVGREGIRFLERFDSTGMCFYGSTEVGFPIANRPITPDTVDVAGWPRPGYETRLVDEAGDDVPDGQVGELWVRPPDRRMILVGYLGKPEQTAQAVVDGWYRTGDAMRRRPNGSYQFVDRLRDTIRRFGENISSSALEEVVLDDPDVLECAAIGIPSEIAGQEVALLVVPSAADHPPAAVLAERLRSTLPRFMRPSLVAVVDELPKTPNGKVRKVGLDRVLHEADGGAGMWRER